MFSIGEFPHGKEFNNRVIPDKVSIMESSPEAMDGHAVILHGQDGGEQVGGHGRWPAPLLFLVNLFQDMVHGVSLEDIKTRAVSELDDRTAPWQACRDFHPDFRSN